MPRATVDKTRTTRHELKSLPEGFVVLRPLSYGEMIERQEMAADFAFKADGRQKQQSTEAVVKMMQMKVTQFEFARCIVEHNLEDENGVLLNFSHPQVVGTLDPKVGEEISKLIDSLNQLDAEGNSEDESTQQ